MKVTYLGLLMVAIIAGCRGPRDGGAGKPGAVPRALPAPTRALSEATRGILKVSPPIRVKDVMIRVEDGTRIGSMSSGLFGMRNHELRWGPALAPSKGELISALVARMRDLGFNAKGYDSQIFGGAGAAEDRYLLGVIVSRMGIEKNYFADSMQSTMVIEWQIFDATKNEVTYATTMTTELLQSDPNAAWLAPTVLHAFDELTMDEKFLTAVAPQSDPTLN